MKTSNSDQVVEYIVEVRDDGMPRALGVTGVGCTSAPGTAGSAGLAAAGVGAGAAGMGAGLGAQHLHHPMLGAAAAGASLLLQQQQAAAAAAAALQFSPYALLGAQQQQVRVPSSSSP